MRYVGNKKKKRRVENAMYEICSFYVCRLSSYVRLTNSVFPPLGLGRLTLDHSP